MKKKILTACVAALSYSQFACDKSLPPSPEQKVETVRDAGFQPEPTLAEVDPLSLPHEEGPNIDHLSRAAQMRELGDLEGALIEARRALFDAPGDLEVLSLIDRLSRLGGETKLRLIALERLAKLEPEDATPLVQLSRAMLSLQDYDGAIRAGLEAVKRDANNPEAYQALGRANLSRGQLPQAIGWFEKVIALQPDHGHALNNLGLAYLRANRNQEALEVLERAVEQLPEVAWVHNNLGVALERLGRLDEAKDEYAHSSELSPKYLKARLNALRVASLGDVAGSVPIDGTEPEPEQ